MKNKGLNITKFYRFNIVLLTINVAVFVVWMMVLSSSSVDPKIKLTSNEFLKDELGLNKNQFESINRLDSENFEHYQRILRLLCTNRGLLMKEISKPAPNKEVIYEITRRIGHLHTALKRQTVNHLLNIKKACTDEQKNKLKTLFEELLEVNNQCKYCKSKCEKSKLK